jgi:uncharacterized protein YheU (UPF0270 family)
VDDDDRETLLDRDELTGTPTSPGLPPRVLVPWDRLSAEALKSVIEEFVTREGTEYGPNDVPLEDKVRQVRKQLEKGEVVVLFDLKTETANLATAREAKAALIE